MLCWKGREATRKTWCWGELCSGPPAKTAMPRALVGNTRRLAGFAPALLLAVDFVDRLFSVWAMIEGWYSD